MNSHQHGGAGNARHASQHRLVELLARGLPGEDWQLKRAGVDVHVAFAGLRENAKEQQQQQEN